MLLISKLNRGLRLGELTSKYNIDSNGWTRFDNIQQLGNSFTSFCDMENTIQTYWNQKFPSECNCTIDTIKTLDVKNNSSEDAFNLFAIDNLDLSKISLAITPTLWILDGLPQHSNWIFFNLVITSKWGGVVADASR